MPSISDINDYRRKWNSGKGLIHFATQDYQILKYVVSQPGVDPNLKSSSGTALHYLSNYKYTSWKKIPPGDVVKMIRILAPFAIKDDLYSGYGKSPLHIAAESGNVEALKALLEFFDPNEVSPGFGLPLERAIKYHKIESVQILAPLTKEFQIDEDFSTNAEKMSKILDILRASIKGRQGVSNDKMEEENTVEPSEPAKKKIRVEPTCDNLYELPFGNEFKVYTKDQIEEMIEMYNLSHNKTR